MADNFITEEHLRKITPEEAKFIFEHAEEQLKELLKTGETVVTRTTTLLTLTIGLLVGLISFGVNRWTNEGIDNLVVASLAEVLFLFIPCWKLGGLTGPVWIKDLSEFIWTKSITIKPK